MAEARSRRIAGPVHRILPSRFPPESLFDIARDVIELEMLAQLEGLTNQRLRQTYGQIRLVAEADARFGPGATPIMAAFCHPAPSRFSDGGFGVYYAGLAEETAILETVYHRERFLRDAQIPREVLEMRRYVSRLLKPMGSLPPALREKLLDPDDYAAAQAFGADLRATGAWGIYYPSVRHRPDGRCVAVLRPPALAPTVQASHYRYFWDGRRIERVEKIEAFAVRELSLTPQPSP